MDELDIDFRVPGLSHAVVVGWMEVGWVGSPPHIIAHTMCTRGLKRHRSVFFFLFFLFFSVFMADLDVVLCRHGIGVDAASATSFGDTSKSVSMLSGGFAPCWRWSGRLLVAGPLTHRHSASETGQRGQRDFTRLGLDGVALDDETAESISDLMSK